MERNWTSSKNGSSQHAALPAALWQGAPPRVEVLQEAAGGAAGAAVAGQVPPDQARRAGKNVFVGSLAMFFYSTTMYARSSVVE